MAIKTVRPEEEIERFAWWKLKERVGELGTRKMRPGQMKDLHEYQDDFDLDPKRSGRSLQVLV